MIYLDSFNENFTPIQGRNDNAMRLEERITEIIKATMNKFKECIKRHNFDTAHGHYGFN